MSGRYLSSDILIFNDLNKLSDIRKKSYICSDAGAHRFF
nr:MAG TPA: hypothetical protein [Caudoviricetes sp.]